MAGVRASSSSGLWCIGVGTGPGNEVGMAGGPSQSALRCSAPGGVRTLGEEETR